MSRAPYREAAPAADARVELAPDRSLCLLDASGRAGRGGAEGASGANGYGSGSDGARGGDAGPAEPGQSAGRISVRMSHAAEGALRVQAEGARADGVAVRAEDIVEFGDAGFVNLIARGGPGGRGGVGGRGGDGARGHHGHDATRYSSGGNGGRGGDGGPGGNGSNGAAGGHGGVIQLRVSDDDTHLLMLVRHAEHGGRGGPSGQNGSGGAGGSGGSGGSSYSWTETEHYTDAQGHSQTRTHHHSNSGGSSGPSGNSGPSGYARLVAGADGRDGSFTIEVESARGIERYTSPYQLKLAGFRHDNENGDGIYEPGEKVRVSDVELHNVGGMPTPRTRPIELTLLARGWVQPVPQKMVAPMGIPAGHGVKLGAEALTFHIGDFVAQGPGDALRAEEQIGLAATLPAVRRTFAGFDAEAGPRSGRFLIRFPLETSAVESLHALAPGQAARVRFSLTNLSQRAFGSASELGRVVRVRLGIERSELERGQAVIYDERGRACGADGFVREVARIEPQATVAFEAAIALTEGAEHYRALTLWLRLELGAIDEPARARPAQIGAFEIRAAARYRHAPDADVLLVVNHATRRDVLDAWRAASERLGLGLAVWDLSLEGGIDFERPAAGGPSLAQAFADKTIVVLDNTLASAAGPSHAHRFCDKGELQRLVAAGTRVLFVGAGPALGDLVAPLASSPATDGAPEKLARRDEQALANAPRPARDALAAALAALPSSGCGGEPLVLPVQVTRWSLPTESALERRAIERAHELVAAFPERRFLVVPRFDPALVKKGLLWHRYALGSLAIYPGLDRAGGICHALASDDELADADAVAGSDTLLTLLLSRSFADRLVRLELAAKRAAALGAAAAPDALEAQGGEDEVPPSSEEPGDERVRAELALVRTCIDALLVGLLHELQCVLASPWRAGLERAHMAQRLGAVSALAAHAFGFAGPPAPSSPLAGELVRLAARLLYFVESEVDWWERLPPFRSWRRAPMARRLCREAVERYLAHVFDAEGSGGRERMVLARKRLRAVLARLARSYRRQRKEGTAFGPRAEHARRLLARPLEREGYSADIELFEAAAERVMAQEELEALVERDRERVKARRKLERAQKSQQASLLLSESAAELAARAASAGV